MKKSPGKTLEITLIAALTLALLLASVGVASAKESKNPYGTGNVAKKTKHQNKL